MSTSKLKRTVIMNHKDEGIRRTSCRFCQYQCGVKSYVKNRKVVRIEGDPENPIGRGKLCPKATVALDFHNHPDRLNYPLKRVGERGEGRWKRISWKQAMDEIASKIIEIKAEYGVEAVAFMGGSPHEPGDWSAWRWCNLFGTPNIHNQGKNCGEAEYLMECATYGYHTLPMPKPGVTKCVVIWGSNPACSSPILYWQTIREAREKGCKIIVVDPRLTETASTADLWLQLRPGTDGALGLGMINVIIKEGLYDKEFVEKYCLGFDEVKGIAEEYTTGKTEKMTWVPEEKIVEAARSIATLVPSVITWGVAACHLGWAAKSAVQVKCILRAITGNLDIEGGNVLKEPFKNIAWFENQYWDLLLDHPDRRRDTISAEMFPVASVKAYRLFRKAMEKTHPYGYGTPMYMLTYSGINLWTAILEGKPYPVKAIITQGGNPLCSLDARGCYGALKSRNLLLHVGMDFFMTPTLALADYVFPAADWLERSTLAFRWGLVNYYVAGEQSVEPQYERRDDYQFWRELGIRVGQEGQWPKTLDEMYDRFLEPTGKTFDAFSKEKEHWYFPREEYKKYESKGFATFSGKVELVPSILQKLGIDPLPRYVEPPLTPISSPELAREYPLILISGSRLLHYWHSCYREEKRLRRIRPDPLLQIHPKTAEKLGITKGDWVYIETPEGRIRQKAELTDRIDPRVVHADAYWWFPEKPGSEPSLFGVWDSNINAIIPRDPRLFDYAGDYTFRGLLCKVYKE
jgi:thiosulfate reductase/polysulfide reductase chain A